ncbi:MAG: HAMP domain-containing histidine kinase [Deltaproteobacteria bacterium]|nr:HAMP domain-containing histidine kinase [Deltaproteobacteria bacterium]
MFRSIKTRLIIFLIPVFAVIVTGLGFFLYNRLDNIVMEMVDHLLSGKADLMKGLVHSDHGDIEFEISHVTFGDYSINASGHYFEIADTKGNSLVKSISLGDHTLTGSRYPENTGYFMGTGPHQEPLRLFIEEFQVLGEKFVIYVGEEIREELALLKNFRIFLLTVFPMTIIIIAIGSMIVIQVSLSPLSSFSRQIGLITEKRLHERIYSQGGDAELQNIAYSFNETMSRLEKAFQAQKDFLSDASHELRTPTAVIKSAADVTLRRERSVVEYREALETVKYAAERMGGLIDRLLKLSRLEADQGQKKEMVGLKDILNTTLRTITPLAEAQGIDIYTEKAVDVTVDGDKDQLSELFLSILDNAIKYNRPNGKVSLSLAISDNWAVVKVEDTGIGIAPEALGKVFDRFYREDMSRGEIPGTGLGLPIAKGIAESHGGSIEVESEVGKGSAFTVYLPLNSSS